MNQAYITLLSNQAYLDGVLVLAESLRTVQAAIPFFVYLPDNIPPSVPEALHMRNIRCIKYNSAGGFEQEGTGYWKDTIAKLRIFGLDQFDKIVFLDADMIVLKNIDFLFDMPHMSAVAAGRELHPDWIKPNSGLMVIEPSKALYNDLVSCIAPAHRESTLSGLPFGDQNVIDFCFPNWPSQNHLHLSGSLNVLLGYGGILKKRKIIQHHSDIYIYHFTGKQKPWGSMADRFAVLLKIMKRSPDWGTDLSIYRKYRSILKRLKKA